MAAMRPPHCRHVSRLSQQRHLVASDRTSFCIGIDMPQNFRCKLLLFQINDNHAVIYQPRFFCSYLLGVIGSVYIASRCSNSRWNSTQTCPNDPGDFCSPQFVRFQLCFDFHTHVRRSLCQSLSSYKCYTKRDHAHVVLSTNVGRQK